MVIGLLLTAGSPIIANDRHDIHLILCELRFNEATASFEVSIKVFIDDLELAMAKDGVKGLKIGTPSEDPLADEHITAYLNKHFYIDIDGARLKANFLGKEFTEDLIAIWCYVEFPAPPAAKKCLLSNNILLDLYDDQRNIMDIRMSKTHKDYTILASGKNTWVYNYQQ